jgi:hypothetical protein
MVRRKRLGVATVKLAQEFDQRLLPDVLQRVQAVKLGPQIAHVLQQPG